MIIAGAVLAFTLTMEAGDVPAHVEALHVNGAPGDDFWQPQPSVAAFVQREPADGAEPSERTEFRVAYNETTLFVRVRAYERHPDGIRTYLTRRDQDSPGD